MFPRRRPPLRRRPQQSKAQQILQRAHHLMEEKEYAQAAEIFERLAQGAKQRGMLQRAPRLFLQAGRAYVLAKKENQGVGCIRQGLNILARSQRWPALHRAGKRVVYELTESEYPKLAQEFEDWLEETLPDRIEDAPRPASTRSVTLPLKCPSCGAPIRSDEVEWADSTTAVCPYCGSGLRRGES